MYLAYCVMINQVVGKFDKGTDFNRFVLISFCYLKNTGRILDLFLWNDDFLVATKFSCLFKDIMNSEKSYDSLPNFTAADCKCYLVALLLSVRWK